MGDRDKRIPYYFPMRQNPYNQARPEDLDEEDETGFYFIRT